MIHATSPNSWQRFSRIENYLLPNLFSELVVFQFFGDTTAKMKNVFLDSNVYKFCDSHTFSPLILLLLLFYFHFGCFLLFLIYRCRGRLLLLPLPFDHPKTHANELKNNRFMNSQKCLWIIWIVWFNLIVFRL